MIFKKLFTPKHKNVDPEIRLQSIEKLDANNQADKQVLHELAFNDSSPKVILSALNKLNSFPLWLKASEISEHNSVKKKALEKVTLELDDPDSDMVSEDQFVIFCKELTNLSLLEKLLLHNVRLQQNDTLAISCLNRLNKENVTRLYFKTTSSATQKQVIVEQTNSINELSKLGKLLDSGASGELLRNIEEKILHIKAAEEKPAMIKQQTTLVTSKLLAAKDINSYEHLLSTQQQLMTEFDQIKSDFSCLDEEQACQLAEKFLSINESVEKRLLSLKEQWQYNQELSKTTDQIAAVEEQLNEVITQIDALIIVEDINQLNTQEKLLTLAINDAETNLLLISKMPKTIAQDKWLDRLSGTLKLQRQRLTNLPAIVEQNAMAAGLIVNFEALISQLSTLTDIKDPKAQTLVQGEPFDNMAADIAAVPEQTIHNQEIPEATLNAALSELTAQWKETIEQSKLPINLELKRNWQAINNAFTTRLKEKSAESDKHRKRVLGKLKAVQRLIDQGKFKPAISSFSNTKKLFENLSSENKQTLSKVFEEIEQKITELQELQAFIAAPRKPMLLEQVLELANDKNPDINKRAVEVKNLRSEWQSLGELKTPEDTAMNQEFDRLIEIAFRPCREYFAEQEKQRDENRQLAQRLLIDITKLQDSDDLPQVAKSLNKLQQAWRGLGQIEQSKYKHFQTEFKKAIEPINQKLGEFYESNAQAKTRLVNKANLLLDLEDIAQASSQAKALQVQWKQIGFAGRKQDDALWKQFRTINDKVFASLNQQYEQTKAQNIEKVNHVKTKLAEIELAISQADDVRTLDECRHNAQLIEPLIHELVDSHQKQALQTLEKLVMTINNKQKEVKSQGKQQELALFFDTLGAWTNDELPEQTRALSNRYQALFKSTLQSDNSRLDITVQSEIIADLPSPDTEQTLRKELQLNLMALRLEGQDLPTTFELLANWVSHGPLSKGDIKLLKRVRKVFIPQEDKVRAVVKKDTTAAAN